MTRLWEQAACGDYAEAFMVERLSRPVLAFCRDVCSRCPVQAECLADADELEAHHDHAHASYRTQCPWCFGVRAGLTPDQRYLRRRDAATRGNERLAEVMAEVYA